MGPCSLVLALLACGTSPSLLPPLAQVTTGAPAATEPLEPSEPAPSDASVRERDAGEDALDASAACPPEMVLVRGGYCPKVRQICARWVDPPGPYHEYRCAEYERPSTCLAARVAKRFCIDREEYAPPGETLPIANQSWTSAGALCASLGKRLCLESEWELACEGEDMHPYPYGDGFTRDATACNIDQRELGRPESGLRDLRAPITAYPRCVSPYGVHGMSGNVEEWATLDRGVAPDRSSMKGAWWLPGKNTCRAATLGHGEIYRGPQVGVRCCRDAGS
ncbi:MAG: SUMF1/EgtB/PvdO family nonheme iron enzyme [Polyangiaceae bacterium]